MLSIKNLKTLSIKKFENMLGALARKSVRSPPHTPTNLAHLHIFDKFFIYIFKECGCKQNRDSNILKECLNKQILFFWGFIFYVVVRFVLIYLINIYYTVKDFLYHIQSDIAKENRIYIRVEFTRKKCKTAILLYCFHTVLLIFVLYNL